MLREILPSVAVTLALVLLAVPGDWNRLKLTGE